MKTTIAGITGGVPSSFLLFSDFFFQMSRPGKLHQQPHQQSRRDGKAALIEKADGHEAKDQRMRRAPEPNILVQDVEGEHGKNKQNSFHIFF